MFEHTVINYINYSISISLTSEFVILLYIVDSSIKNHIKANSIVHIIKQHKNIQISKLMLSTIMIVAISYCMNLYSQLIIYFFCLIQAKNKM